MSHMTRPDRPKLILEGIFPPMITPLKDRNTLDRTGLSRLIEHLIAGGVHGIFLLGTTGEAPSLSYDLREELVFRTCDQVAGRLPVLVGITDSAYQGSVYMSDVAREAGAQAVVLAPPYYFSAGQPELIEYLKHLLPEISLPVVLYNIPSHTKIPLALETVHRAIEYPNVIGLKDSSLDMIYFQRLQQLLYNQENFSLLVGADELLAQAVLLGARGGVTGGANFYPRLFADLYNAARRGDLAEVRKLQATVMQISATIYEVGRYESRIIKGIKCALSCLEICEDFMAEPFHRFRKAERDKIKEHLIQLGLPDQSGHTR